MLTKRDINKVTLVVITGDRGLCGGYNSYMIKKAEARIKELKEAGLEYELVLIGKKGASYFNRRDVPIAFQMDCTQKPTAKMANEISELVAVEGAEGACAKTSVSA